MLCQLGDGLLDSIATAGGGVREFDAGLLQQRGDGLDVIENVLRLFIGDGAVSLEE